MRQRVVHDRVAAIEHAPWNALRLRAHDEQQRAVERGALPLAQRRYLDRANALYGALWDAEAESVNVDSTQPLIIRAVKGNTLILGN